MLSSVRAPMLQVSLKSVEILFWLCSEWKFSAWFWKGEGKKRFATKKDKCLLEPVTLTFSLLILFMYFYWSFSRV